MFCLPWQDLIDLRLHGYWAVLLEDGSQVTTAYLNLCHVYDYVYTCSKLITIYHTATRRRKPGWNGQFVHSPLITCRVVMIAAWYIVNLSYHSNVISCSYICSEWSHSPPHYSWPPAGEISASTSLALIMLKTKVPWDRGYCLVRMRASSCAH